MRLASLFLAVVAACGPWLLRGADARPLVPAERRYSPFSGFLPFCDDPAVLDRIQSRFRDREKEFWSTGLEILTFENIGEIGYRTNGLDHIPRRYCIARIVLNNMRPDDVTYSISQDLGTIGFGFGVDWCVGELDRLDAYAPNCKMVRP